MNDGPMSTRSRWDVNYCSKVCKNRPGLTLYQNLLSRFDPLSADPTYFILLKLLGSTIFASNTEFILRFRTLIIPCLRSFLSGGKSLQIPSLREWSRFQKQKVELGHDFGWGSRMLALSTFFSHSAEIRVFFPTFFLECLRYITSWRQADYFLCLIYAKSQCRGLSRTSLEKQKI